MSVMRVRGGVRYKKIIEEKTQKSVRCALQFYFTPA